MVQDPQTIYRRRIRKRKLWLAAICGVFAIGVVGNWMGPAPPPPTPEEIAKKKEEDEARAKRREEAERARAAAEAREQAERERAAAVAQEGAVRQRAAAQARNLAARGRAAALTAIPGIARAEWRDGLLYVFVSGQGTKEDFEMLSLQICRYMARDGYRHFTVMILDTEFALLGKKKERDSTYCR